MKPIQDVLNRIRWDSNLDTSKFAFYYYDRIENRLIRREYADMQDIDPNKSFNLPLHRIRRVEYQGKVIWERKNDNRKL